jgi:hypothetical protein
MRGWQGGHDARRRRTWLRRSLTAGTDHAIFDDFCTANDPHDEHDFGAFEFEGARIMFKIDYYDNDLNFHSPNPADPAVTERVLTIMLAEEY